MAETRRGGTISGNSGLSLALLDSVGLSSGLTSLGQAGKYLLTVSW